MRIRHSRRPMPRNIRRSRIPGADRIVAACDISLRRHSRLALKVIVFRNTADLRRFWRDGLQRSELGRYCRGCVNSLGCEVLRFPKGKPETRHLEVDPRYFALMGLVLTHLGTEVIMHESVHAAFSYAKRVNTRDLWANARDLDEENVCYPAGIIASQINKFLHEEGLYEIYQKGLKKRA